MPVTESSSPVDPSRLDRGEVAGGPAPAPGLLGDGAVEPLKLNPDGSLVPLEPGSWFVCFVPPIDRQWWHPLLHHRHKHVFALHPEGNDEWTVFEPWWTRLLTATITDAQATKFLRWGGQGDVLLVREAVPGHSSQLRGMMTCAALVTHMLGRKYFVWTPHQLYRVLKREPNVCHVNVSALLHEGGVRLAAESARTVWACDHCRPGQVEKPTGAAKPFCMKCGRDIVPRE